MPERSDEARRVRIRVICISPPAELHNGEPTTFGLQDKRRAIDTGAQHPDGSVEFECVVEVRRRQTDGGLRFTGPCVHGTATDPFLYLSLRREGDDASWIKRIKVPLGDISYRQVDEATATEGRYIEGSVDGSGVARVSLLGEGWRVSSR